MSDNGHTRGKPRPEHEILDKYWCPRYQEWMSFEEFIYRRNLEKAEEKRKEKEKG
jgi:hypothetical protein